MAKTGIQHKRRRYVHKQEQSIKDIYYGGNDGANKGTTYTHTNSPLSKGSTLDNLQGENKERRGRKHTGQTHHKSTTTGQKARSRSANKRNKAKRGGN